MVNFIVIFSGVFLGIVASYAMMLVFMLNKKAMEKMITNTIETGLEITKELSEDKRYEDWL